MDAMDANILARTGCFTLQWPRGTRVSILPFSSPVLCAYQWLEVIKRIKFYVWYKNGKNRKTEGPFRLF